MCFRYKTPRWKTPAVRHSGIRLKRQSERRPKPSTDPIYFLNSENYSKNRNNAPKNRGRRLHLENIK